MISPVIQTLLDRMDKFPKEFVDDNVGTDYVEPRDMIEDTKWYAVSDTMISQANKETSFKIFTPEEVNAYVEKLTVLMRRKFEEGICSELVRFEEKKNSKQLELPFISQLTAQHQDLAEHIREHMRHIGIPENLIKKEKP